MPSRQEELLPWSSGEVKSRYVHVCGSHLYTAMEFRALELTPWSYVHCCVCVMFNLDCQLGRIERFPRSLVIQTSGCVSDGISKDDYTGPLT
jgi:hypothetical protein